MVRNILKPENIFEAYFPTVLQEYKVNQDKQTEAEERKEHSEPGSDKVGSKRRRTAEFEEKIKKKQYKELEI